MHSEQAALIRVRASRRVEVATKEAADEHESIHWKSYWRALGELKELT
jgi:hypothetical protein